MRMIPNFTCGLFVTLIDDCNINCSFCPFPKRAEFRSGKVMDCDKFLKMLHGIKTSPPPISLGAVCFCGSGEPLLYDDLAKLVAETTKQVPQVSVVTNGLLLDGEMSEQLLYARANHIVVSITGDSGKVYKLYQGNGQPADMAEAQLELVRRNVVSFVRLRDSQKAVTRIGISYILSEDSRQDFFSALNYYREIGVDYVDVRIRSDGFSLTFEKDEFSEYLSKNRTKFDAQGGACTCFGKVMNVSTDGTLRFCNCAYIDKTIIGNIFKQSLSEILSSEKFTALLEAFHGEYEKIPEYCKICDLGRARPILA